MMTDKRHYFQPCETCQSVLISNNYPNECSHPCVAKTFSTKYTRNCFYQRSRVFYVGDTCGRKGKWWVEKHD